jgi:hypothetical protein
MKTAAPALAMLALPVLLLAVALVTSLWPAALLHLASSL